MWDSGLFFTNLQRGVPPGLEQGRPFSRRAAHAVLRPEGKSPTVFPATVHFFSRKRSPGGTFRFAGPRV